MLLLIDFFIKYNKRINMEQETNIESSLSKTKLALDGGKKKFSLVSKLVILDRIIKIRNSSLENNNIKIKPSV